MSKHTPTPGPWFVDPKRAMRVMTADDETVASTGATDTQRDHWEANAILIAAAPELLDACVEGLEFLRLRGDDGGELGAFMRAAIRKATGEQK